jgi:hypothetical protein
MESVFIYIHKEFQQAKFSCSRMPADLGICFWQYSHITLPAVHFSYYTPMNFYQLSFGINEITHCREQRVASNQTSLANNEETTSVNV